MHLIFPLFCFCKVFLRLLFLPVFLPIFQNKSLTSAFSLHLFHKLITAFTIRLLRNYDPLKQYYWVNPKNFPERLLIFPYEGLVSADSAHTDPDCIPITDIFFPPLTDSNSLGIADYDDHIKKMTEYSTNLVFEFMRIQDLYTLHHICELDRTQMLTIKKMSVQTPQLVGYHLTAKHSNFVIVEVSTGWL